MNKKVTNPKIKRLTELADVSHSPEIELMLAYETLKEIRKQQKETEIKSKDKNE